MDWGSVLTAVIAGLVIAGVLGVVRWLLKRREQAAKQAELHYVARTPIRVGGHIVAEELGVNAEVSQRYEEAGPGGQRSLVSLK
jgi:hypothetical protein